MNLPVTERVAKTPRHTTFYLSCGADDAPPIVFVHGWPELSVSWRHQLRCFGALGFRAIAPDMRGYGRSSVYRDAPAYALEHTVADMIELLDSLGRDRAVWVGHDWGAPIVWSIASHHPQRVAGVASLCVPYIPGGFAPENIVPLADRRVYPEDLFPAAQWDYQLFYQENFEQAVRTLEADPAATIKALMRRGNPDGRGKPGRLATIRRDGGWFGGAPKAPDLPLDTAVLTEEDLHQYASALARNGFAAPCAWYLNAKPNRAYAARAANDGKLEMPVLFFHGAYDYTCETIDSRLAEPMRGACPNLTELVVPSGHWMAQERPTDVNAGLAKWLAVQLPQYWAIGTDPWIDGAAGPPGGHRVAKTTRLAKMG